MGGGVGCISWSWEGVDVETVESGEGRRERMMGMKEGKEGRRGGEREGIQYVQPIFQGNKHAEYQLRFYFY